MKNTNEIFNNSVDISRFIIMNKVKLGDCVVDATMGNGNDTLVLAKAVGKTGKVYGFEIQQVAIDKTRALLEQNDLSDRVKIIHDGHENVDLHVVEGIDLILFNLGYLPGGDKAIATNGTMTIAAIQKSLDLLNQYGLIIVVIYPGHVEGLNEKKEILNFTSQLPQKEYNVFQLDLINQKNNPPVLLGIEKRT